MNELIERLSRNIDNRRIPHAIETSKLCKELCGKYKYRNRENLLNAALLHDVSKELSLDQHLTVIRWKLDNDPNCKYIGEIDPIEYSHEVWAHCISGAILSEEIFGLSDIDALKAIRYHKTVTIFDPLPLRILYVSDMANALRSSKRLISAHNSLMMDKLDFTVTLQNLIYFDIQEYEQSNTKVPSRFLANLSDIDDSIIDYWCMYE